MDFFKKALWFLSAEHLLVTADGTHKHANGGEIVLLRSAMVTVPIWALAVWLYAITVSDAQLDWNGEAFRYAVHETLPWAGAIFAGVYASLYSRFAAQWSYLAGLYNQIVAAEIGIVGTLTREAIDARRATEPMEQDKLLAAWKAGFIEDADELHLATKRLYAPAVLHWMRQRDVRCALIHNSIEGQRRYDNLLARLKAVTGRLDSSSPEPDQLR